MANNESKFTFWRTHYTAWQKSGLTRQAYCADKAIKFSTFKSWTKHVKGNPGNLGNPSIPTASSATSTLPPKSPSQTLTLVPLRVVPPASVQTFVLRSSSQWELHFPAQVSPDLIAQLLRQLP